VSRVPRLDRLPKGGRGRRGRSQHIRKLRRSFLIVCEGEVTEVRYFEAFPVPKEVHLAVHGEGKNTTSLVAAALIHADRAANDRTPFDEVWVVYDHDDFKAERFNSADAEIRVLDNQRGERWQAAWSHEAFEVWYLLHFQLFESRLNRHLVNDKFGKLLNQHCGRDRYRKNDPNIYGLLLDYQGDALQNARKLAMKHAVGPFGDTTPANANPCTLVYLLVEALNAEIR
jgi:hypothetical protein